MDTLPATPEEKAQAKFILTSVYAGLLLFRNYNDPLINPQQIVNQAELCAEEIIKRLPDKK